MSELELSMLRTADWQALCVNPAVAALSSAARVNEACTDMQRAKGAPKKQAAEDSTTASRQPKASPTSFANEGPPDMFAAHFGAGLPHKGAFLMKAVSTGHGNYCPCACVI